MKIKLIILVLITCLFLRNRTEYKYTIHKNKYIYYVNKIDTIDNIISYKNSNNTRVKIDTLK